MWIGTSNGLVRHDGSEVLVFQHDEADSTSISGNHITAIEMEGDSIMWVATVNTGLNKFNFKTQIFKRYFPEIDDPSSLPSEEVNSLKHDASGTLWIGFHRNGICKYNRSDDSFEKIELPNVKNERETRQRNIINKIIFDKKQKHIVWLFSISHLIRYNDHSKNTRFYSFQNPNNEQNQIVDLRYGIFGLDGKIYIPTTKNGVIVFDPESEKWDNFNEKDYNPLNLRENSYRTIEQIDSNTFWLGSPTRGLAILDLSKGYIFPVDSCTDDNGDQLCKLFITCMDMNEGEGHWIGTNRGLRLYNKLGNQFKIFKHNAELKNLKNRTTIVAIYQKDENGFYYGGYAGEGLYYFSLKNNSNSLIQVPEIFRPGNNFEMFSTRSILPYDDTTLIVLSSNAFFKLHTLTNRMEEIETGLLYKNDYFYLNRLFSHSDGSYYLSTRHNGIYHLSSDFSLKEHLFRTPGLKNSLVSSNYIYEISEDPNGNVWIGTEDGFSVFNPTTFTFTNSDFKLRLDSVPQLKIIFSIKLAPDSSLWFIDARANAVSIKYPYNKPYTYHPVITGRNSLAERVNNTLFTNDGKTILATERGLSIIRNDSTIEHYNAKQGLPGLNPLNPLVELSDGRVVIGSQSKLTLFHPDSLYSFPKDIPIYISSISIFNEKYDVNLNEVNKNGISLTYKQNYFSIGIGVINYDNPEEYQLSYRLKGLSDEWITDKDRKAVFTNVPGGKYLFEARILDRNNEVLAQSLSMPLEIIPPFWKTLWFKIAAFSLFLFIGWAFYFIRVRSIKREAKLKTAFNKQIANMELSALRAQMNPHFLFNSLNSIRNKIINNDPAEADKYLVKFSRLVRQVLHNSREKLINLNDEMETLRLYIDLESSRFEHRFEYYFKIAEGLKLEKLKIPPLIIQPYVENAIWHGLMQKEDNGKVTISISIVDDSLNIVIEDDGIGREKAKELKSKTALKRQSMGMGITGDRLEIIEKIYHLSCTAEITDLKNKKGEAVGTRITLTLPLIYDS